MQSRCYKIRLKPGAIDRAREWAQVINQRSDEAIETLRNETVFIESVFLDQTESGDFLIYFMKAENFEKSIATAQQSIHAIDEYHRKFKQDNWEKSVELELLIDLDRFSEL